MKRPSALWSNRMGIVGLEFVSYKRCRKNQLYNENSPDFSQNLWSRIQSSDELTSSTTKLYRPTE